MFNILKFFFILKKHFNFTSCTIWLYSLKDFALKKLIYIMTIQSKLKEVRYCTEIGNICKDKKVNETIIDVS